MVAASPRPHCYVKSHVCLGENGRKPSEKCRLLPVPSSVYITRGPPLEQGWNWLRTLQLPNVLHLHTRRTLDKGSADMRQAIMKSTGGSHPWPWQPWFYVSAILQKDLLLDAVHIARCLKFFHVEQPLGTDERRKYIRVSEEISQEMIPCRITNSAKETEPREAEKWDLKDKEKLRFIYVKPPIKQRPGGAWWGKNKKEE
ncbi:uncharacterized protein LOC128322537 isoform X4 [Hemicordylus capensis]|uniref:uncharacterized protein LOC128322537 isoform X4 n=1 Tax=Hemicordylus capensis TaxID=884348 RepID=UPI002304B221|nr:uncharacterized protein LOC128322537 isoform X4 [Hemicordylus capensis]XP_053099946.1 uncharacterized protein LOC128322537 isoform X4 [Hemicordylus capensis]XP_053099947.1 uncharacterized protein LOC128322537 isoform X4 [Hemicordylus capensis]